MGKRAPFLLPPSGGPDRCASATTASASARRAPTGRSARLAQAPPSGQPLSDAQLSNVDVGRWIENHRGCRSLPGIVRLVLPPHSLSGLAPGASSRPRPHSGPVVNGIRGRLFDDGLHERMPMHAQTTSSPRVGPFSCGGARAKSADTAGQHLIAPHMKLDRTRVARCCWSRRGPRGSLGQRSCPRRRRVCPPSVEPGRPKSWTSKPRPLASVEPSRYPAPRTPHPESGIQTDAAGCCGGGTCV